jgi:hypothetical protein
VFGTRIAETILASVHVRARKQAGHMDASDLIRALPKITLRGGGRPHMESRYSLCGSIGIATSLLVMSVAAVAIERS